MDDLFSQLPSISFGKRKDLPANVVEDYLILEASTKGFNAQERKIFEGICRGFSWKSKANPGAILPPCYGLWPWGDHSNTLVIRFMDDGRDNQGRPDLLRVDAVKIPTDLFHSPEFNSNYLFMDDSWRSVFPGPEHANEISMDDEKNILQAYWKNPKDSLLIGDPGNFLFKVNGVAVNTYDLKSKTIEENQPEVPGKTISMPPTVFPPVKPLGASKKLHGITIVLLVVALLGLGWNTNDLYKKLDGAKGEADTAKDEAKTAKGEVAQLNKEIERLEEEIKNTKSRNAGEVVEKLIGNRSRNFVKLVQLS